MAGTQAAERKDGAAAAFRCWGITTYFGGGDDVQCYGVKTNVGREEMGEVDERTARAHVAFLRIAKETMKAPGGVRAIVSDGACVRRAATHTLRDHFAGDVAAKCALLPRRLAHHAPPPCAPANTA